MKPLVDVSCVQDINFEQTMFSTDSTAQEKCKLVFPTSSGLAWFDGLSFRVQKIYHSRDSSRRRPCLRVTEQEEQWIHDEKIPEGASPFKGTSSLVLFDTSVLAPQRKAKSCR